MRTATGRCGEESTFTVAALRTVGIPARQVYTPRWAHTDDNHAWVEAWVDGQWCFLGACEPEPVLNLGWFNQPASRGMLMHTKVFGRYEGPEDVIAKTPCHTEINVTANYAPVARTVVRVVDTVGRPVPDAVVDFRLYNYAELYTVMTTRSDKAGCASITAGEGDLVAWASQGDRFGFVRFTPGRDTEVRLPLSHSVADTFSIDLTLTPPRGRNNLPEVSAEAARVNDHRKAVEDSIRMAYVATFPDSAATAAFCRAEGFDYAAIRPLVVKSCGNYADLFSLLRATPEGRRPLVIALLRTLTDKDLRDFSLSTLTDHIAALPMVKGAVGDTLLRYVFCPRIADEHLTPWRPYFRRVLTAKQQSRFRADPRRLARFVQEEIVTDTAHNPAALWLSPEGAFCTRRADVRSKGLLFVAAARSCDIPSRIDEVTGKVQYLSATGWQDVSFTKEAGKGAPTGSLALTYSPRRYMENPRYYGHFTLSRLVAGRPVLQNYPESSTWQTDFHTPATVDAGSYLLTSGTRMADGSVLARLSVLSVAPGAQVQVPLLMRRDSASLQVIGSFNSENRYRPTVDAIERSLLSTTGRGYYVCALLQANHEPSNHILHDLERLRTELEAWGRPIVLLFTSAEELARFEARRGEFPNLPRTVSFGIDSTGAVAAELLGGTLAQGRELPFLVLSDTFNRVVFSTQGYTISVGEQIKQAVEKLGE